MVINNIRAIIPLSKKFENYLFFHDDTIASCRTNLLKEHFLMFLIATQQNSLVYIWNSNSIEKKVISFDKYDELIEKLENDVIKSSQITESPDLNIAGINDNWEYTSNVVVNLSVLGYNSDIAEVVENIFLPLISNEELSYLDLNDYIKKNKFLLGKLYTEESIRRYFN